MGIVGSTNLAAEKVKELMLNHEERLENFPENVQIAMTVEWLDTMGMVRDSTLKMFGIDEYTLGAWARDGITGVASELVIPPVPGVDNAIRGGMAAAEGDFNTVGKELAQITGYITIVGRWIREHDMLGLEPEPQLTF